MDFCGNYVFQPQWMQPPNFWNTPGIDMMDRNRNFMHIQHKSCYRCGDLFSHGHNAKCHARNAKCFKCGKLGHFGRKCFARTRINTNEICNLQVQTSKPKQTKSSAKRRRDKNRIKEYKAKRQVLLILPFCDIPNNEISELLHHSNNVQIKTIEKQNLKLKKKIKTKETDCDKLQRENHGLKKEIQILQIRCDQLHTKTEQDRNFEQEIQNLRKKCQENQQTIYKYHEHLRKSQEDRENYVFEIDVLQRKLASADNKSDDLSRENLKLSDKIKNLQTTVIGDLKLQISELTKQKQKLERVCEIFKSDRDDYCEAIEIVQDGLNPRYPANRRILADIKEILHKESDSDDDSGDLELILEYMNTYHV